jgi:hypothetical protein
LRRGRFIALAGLAVSTVFAPAASADNLSAQCSNTSAATYIQDVLDGSSAGDVITLAEGSVCSPDDDELSEFRLPSHAITLQGNGTGAPEIFDGESSNRIMRGTDVGATVIRNLTFQNGEYGGSGAAIKIQGNSTPTISNIVVDDTESGDRAPVTVATSGAGGTVRVENSTFTENSATSGGGLHIDTAHAIVLSGNTFSDNEADTEGGGAVLHLRFDDIAAPGAVTVTGNTFVDNALRRQGEAIYGERLGGGLAIRAADDFRSVTQSGNRFTENVIVPDFGGFPGPERGETFQPVYMGGGEYVEAPATSTNDRYHGNLIVPETGDNRGTTSFGHIAGGGLAHATLDEAFTARNLVATRNGILGGVGGAIASLDRPDQQSPNTEARGGSQGGLMQLLDSTVVQNAVGLGSGAAIAGDFVDDLVVHNGIVYDNTGGNQLYGFNDGGSIDIRYTDICDDPAPGRVAGEGNICADPLLKDAATGDVHQTAGSPTRDVGSNVLVPGNLTGDWEGDARIGNGKVDMGADELGGPKPEPKPEPAAQPQPPPAAAVAGTQQRSCKSRRSFRIRLRIPKGKKALSAVVRVNGKKVRVVRGKRLRSAVRLRGLPKGTVRVRITIRLANGKRISGVRTYHTCIPKLPGDGPPKV